MTTRFDTLTRPAAGADWRKLTRHRNVGFSLAVVGLMLAVITLIANLVAAGDVESSGSVAILRWSFGLTTLSFALIKVAIATILLGILVRLWHRVDAVKASLPSLQALPKGGVEVGDATTDYGRATASASAPKPLQIHKMAQSMWAPMWALGAMAVVVGFIVSLAWAGDETSVSLGAWTQGLQFLGEAMLLAAIGFMLGTILASLRAGGGQVQESLGLTVKTLDMPATAKAFVGLMMLGLMLGILQFALYLVVAGGVDDPAAWFAWLGPFRELSLGLILAGIVMALVTIGNVLGFQFTRIREIITTGR